MGLDKKNKFGMGALAPLPRFIFFVTLSLASTFFTYNWLGVSVAGVIITIIYLAGRVYSKIGLITCTVAGTLSFLANPKYSSFIYFISSKLNISIMK